jgi:hypothetical protein
MKSRRTFALVFFAFLTTAVSAHAQIGIYGNFNATHDSLSDGQASFWAYGPNAGIYYDFVHLGPIGLGLDARANYLFGDQYKYRSVLFGVRVAAKTPILPLRPYAQFSVGAGGPSTTATPAKRWQQSARCRITRSRITGVANSSTWSSAV